MMISYGFPYYIIGFRRSSVEFVTKKPLQQIHFVYTVTWSCLIVCTGVNSLLTTSVNNLKEFLWLLVVSFNVVIKLSVLIYIFIFHRTLMKIFNKILKLGHNRFYVAKKVCWVFLVLTTHFTTVCEMINIQDQNVVRYLRSMAYLQKNYAHSYTVIYLDFALSVVVNYLLHHFNVNWPLDKTSAITNILNAVVIMKHTLRRTWRVLQALVFLQITSDVLELILSITQASTEGISMRNFPYLFLPFVRIVISLRLPTGLSKFVRYCLYQV